jgi:hypothetical protein
MHVQAAENAEKTEKPDIFHDARSLLIANMFR